MKTTDKAIAWLVDKGMKPDHAKYLVWGTLVVIVGFALLTVYRVAKKKGWIK